MNDDRLNRIETSVQERLFALTERVITLEQNFEPDIIRNLLERIESLEHKLEEIQSNKHSLGNRIVVLEEKVEGLKYITA